MRELCYKSFKILINGYSISHSISWISLYVLVHNWVNNDGGNLEVSM